jgi:hypothetical protein
MNLGITESALKLELHHAETNLEGAMNKHATDFLGGRWDNNVRMRAAEAVAGLQKAIERYDRVRDELSYVSQVYIRRLNLGLDGNVEIAEQPEVVMEESAA